VLATITHIRILLLIPFITKNHRKTEKRAKRQIRCVVPFYTDRKHQKLNIIKFLQFCSLTCCIHIELTSRHITFSSTQTNGTADPIFILFKRTADL